jgi:DNA-binding CsgD family transcriptional regulator
MDVGRSDLDIICLLARGHDTREVAASLRMSEHTVRRRLAGLMQLTSSDNRQELISLAYAVGLLVPTWPPITAQVPPDRAAQLLTTATRLPVEGEVSQ